MDMSSFSLEGKIALITGASYGIGMAIAKVHVSMRNVTENSFELVYSIGEGILDNAAKQNQMDISEKLIKIDGVRRVNIVDQKDELSQ